jgi:hypothetical protein
MQEIRWRIDSIFLIEGQLGKTLNTLQHFIANETYLLQLRMIFESIALGCMIVHGDIPITKSGKLTKFYQADILLKALSKAHPNFFPVPVAVIVNPAMTPAYRYVPRKYPLTKEDIGRLYQKYGEYLHRGKVSSFVANRHSALKPLGKEIGDTARALQELLNPHTIHLRDSPVGLLCRIGPVVEVQYFSTEPPEGWIPRPATP